MKTKIFLLLFFCSLSFVSLSADYYWVNGSGNWSEQSHWSLTSGGPPATSLPGNADNVIIDVNSGITGTPFTITINEAISVFNITIENEFASITVNGYTINCNDFVVVKANELEAVNSSFTLTGEK